jgi:hypothetical protein
MTHKQAVAKAKRISNSADWYVTLSAQPHEYGVLKCYTVVVDGVHQISTVSFDNCFELLEAKIKAAMEGRINA